MSETYYVKITVVTKQCTDVEADSPEDAIAIINKVLDETEFFDDEETWTIVDYNIEVQDDE